MSVDRVIEMLENQYKTPEPLPVQISAAVCPKHNFNLVSVPRDSGTGEHQTFKCPLRACKEGR